MKHYVLDRMCQFCHKKYGEIKLEDPMEFPGKYSPQSHGVCPKCHSDPQCGTCCWPLWYCGHRAPKEVKSENSISLPICAELASTKVYEKDGEFFGRCPSNQKKPYGI